METRCMPMYVMAYSVPDELVVHNTHRLTQS
jgi:hypothetical protein